MRAMISVMGFRMAESALIPWVSMPEGFWRSTIVILVAFLSPPGPSCPTQMWRSDCGTARGERAEIRDSLGAWQVSAGWFVEEDRRGVGWGGGCAVPARELHRSYLHRQAVPSHERLVDAEGRQLQGKAGRVSGTGRAARGACWSRLGRADPSALPRSSQFVTEHCRMGPTVPSVPQRARGMLPHATRDRHHSVPHHTELPSRVVAL